MSKILQVWQYGQPTAAETTFDDAIATAQHYGFDALLLKALDGLTWMAEVDSHADAIGSVDQVRELADRAHAAGLKLYVWTNPLQDGAGAFDEDAEARLTGELANACDGVFLDTEPYRQFWNSTAPIGQAARFMEILRQVAPQAFVVLQPDPRPNALAGIRVAEWVPGCDAIAGQHYWSTFGTDARAELDYATSLGVQFGLPVYPTLPGNADPSSVPSDVVPRFPGFVVWRLGSTGPAMLQVLGAISVATLTPAPPAPESIVSRETPDDYPFAEWRASAIAYRGALDDMGHQLDAQKALTAAAQEQRDVALAGAPKLMDDLTAARARVQDLEARIHTAGTALGLVA